MGMMKFSKIVFYNLFTKPVTTMYPLKKKEFFERTRGHVTIAINTCIFCGICSKKCPTNAIYVMKSEKSWSIERLKCIQCNSCVENCPKKCLKMDNHYTPPSVGNVKENYNA